MRSAVSRRRRAADAPASFAAVGHPQLNAPWKHTSPDKRPGHTDSEPQIEATALGGTGCAH